MPICRRKSDGTLWAASSPQRLDYAMRGMFSGKAGWHFAKVRIWLGVPIVSPKVVWSFNRPGQFEVVNKQPAYWMKPWDEATECARIDAILPPT